MREKMEKHKLSTKSIKYRHCLLVFNHNIEIKILYEQFFVLLVYLGEVKTADKKVYIIVTE